MNKKILVLYEHIEGYYTFDYFRTIEDAKYFSKHSNLVNRIIECYDLSNSIEINIQ